MLMIPLRVSIVVSLIAVASLGLTAHRAWAVDGNDGDHIMVVPGNNGGKYDSPSVTLGASINRTSSNEATRFALGGHEGTNITQSACVYTPTGIVPYQLRHQFAEYQSSLPQWGSGSVGYEATCNGVDIGWVLGDPAAPTGGAVVAPTPAVLAQQAYRQLVLPRPVPQRSPNLVVPGGSATIVGEHTWIWIDRGTWKPISQRVQVGAVWAEATATPMSLTFIPGDGNRSVMCAGPGTPYAASYGVHAASPDCDYVFLRSSYGFPNDQVTARYAITWHVSWSGAIGAAPAGGVLPDMISRTSADFAVVEVQAVKANSTISTR